MCQAISIWFLYKFYFKNCVLCYFCYIQDLRTMWKITIFKLAYYVITEYNPIMLLKRKIYSSLLKWKEKEGKTALLVEGARRVGKSTIAEEFAKNEYKSYIIIDFSKCTSVVKNAFLEQMSHLDVFFQIMSIEYGVELVERNTLFIFDEVQLFPKAREAIKHLVADGRFDYLETGSLISIRENVENILIPSEEESVKMHPLDFEEFAWALGQEKLVDYIAMDIKSPLNKYEQTVCRSIDIGKISESIEFIMSCGVEYEFRTTVVRSQLDILDFENIGKTLKGAKRYYLQKFRSDITLNPDFSKEQTYTDMEFEKIQSILKSYIYEVLIR